MEDAATGERREELAALFAARKLEELLWGTRTVEDALRELSEQQAPQDEGEAAA